ncbi:MAG TPA: glycosyltransferase family 4 protein [Acetobacteraceae bacterium]|nr:glycosyltransferase family 4 protein [Acetobacteraceae bacterium]
MAASLAVEEPGANLAAAPDVRNLTVLQVLPSLVTGGVERGTIEITQAIADAGGTALVASAGGRLVTAIERAGGRHITLPLMRKDPFAVWRNGGLLATIIRGERVDIVHARSRAPAWSAWLACRRADAHFVTTWHGTYTENLPLKRRYNSVMAKGERVIVASRFVARLVEERHGVDPDRIRLIPRGVNPKVFDPKAVSGDRVMRLLRAWRVPEHVPVLVLPGRLTEWKGHGVLLEAIARMGRRDVCCVLVGAEQGRVRYTARLVARAETLGIADRLRLAGECDDMPAALMAADIVVHASTQAEAFGRVVVEAQALGRPVIAADLGGPAETVEHGVTGWRVPAGDAAILAEAIDAVLALPAETLNAVGAQARVSVLRDYTVSRMQAATLSVYREVMG